MINFMNSDCKFFHLLSLLLLAALSHCVMAEAQCTACHSMNASKSSHSLTPTVRGDENSRNESSGCVSCHGASIAHLGNPIEESPDIPFSSRKNMDETGDHAVKWNNQCLACHKKNTRHWEASAHAQEDMTCNACHRIHESINQITINISQADTCGRCHQKVRKEFLLPSRHPLNEKEMSCTDCHSPHGSLSSSQLKEVTTNATCLNCHEAQRGPFIFDHPPASEDCLSCHKPHGSIHKPLLTSRGPQLCQQCHMANFHPSNLEAGGGLPGKRPSASLLGRNCMNCHPKIHGSNHPSGARLTK